MRSSQTKEINYIYFLFLFVSLLGISTARLFYQPDLLVHEKYLFFTHFFFACCIEIGVLFLLNELFKKTKIHFLYLIFVFFVLLAHLIDLVVLRLMDNTVFYAYKIFFTFSLKHFITTLYASNLSLNMHILIWSSLLFFPLLGIFFYKITLRLSQKKVLAFSLKKTLKSFSACMILFIFFDLLIYKQVLPEHHLKLQKASLFHTTLFKPKLFQTKFLSKWIKLRNEKPEVSSILPEKGPNIFLFVVETFRKDFLTKQTAPALFALSKKHTSFDLSIANANESSLSWYSIFHSHLPFHRSSFLKEKKFGASPLQLLKKLGYQIHVYTSTDLNYFEMDEMLFGKNYHLVDHFNNFFKTDSPANQCDTHAMKTLQADLKTLPKQNNLFIVFLDSTHSEYYWPKNFPEKFSPYAEKIDYLFMQQDKDSIEKIKNRYRNSIYFVDRLFSNFFRFLKKHQSFDSSMIAITGDHGEEFFEHGALFHGSHLNFFQVHVPIIYKFPRALQRELITQKTSHIDIFPTILDVVTDSNHWDNQFDGTSVFSTKRVPFLMAFQQNGEDYPNIFFVHNGKYIMTAKFLTHHKDFSKIEVLSLEDLNEKKIISIFSPKDIQSFLNKNFSNCFAD